MKTQLKLLLLAAALCAAPFAPAQIVLQTFDDFASENTFFVGTWDGGGNAPLATFSQDVGNYRFEGGLNDDASGAFHFFADGPLDLTGFGALELSAQLLADNAATTFSIKLFNGIESATAVFLATDFTTSGFTNVSATLTFSSGFDLTAVDSFLITGDQIGGTAPMNLAFDRLAIAVPIPEPATYGALGGIFIVALVLVRRRRGQAAKA